MKNFKLSKRFIILFIELNLLLSSFLYVSAASSKIGDVLNTDIIAFINNYAIPSFNIDNSTAIVAEDLSNYGFTVKWNEKERTLKITLEGDLKKKKITPLEIEKNTSIVGSKRFSYYYTDIVTYVNGKKVDSYNITGKTIIKFSSLGSYGKFTWDNDKRASKLTIKDMTSSSSESILIAPTPEPTTEPTIEPTTAAPTTTKSNGTRGNEDNFTIYNDSSIPEGAVYVGNASTMKFHRTTCSEVKKIKPSNKVALKSKSNATSNGYVACKKCTP